MPKEDIVIVFDCGATNVRVIAINSKGIILASESTPKQYKTGSFLSFLQDMGCRGDMEENVPGITKSCQQDKSQ